MKRFLHLALLTALAIATVALTQPAPAHAAQVQYPAELEYYDAQIDLMLPRLADFQAQYYAVNGRYYQALASHAVAPDVPAVPDRINASPSDQPEDLALFWDTFADLPPVLAWAFRIDTYNGPSGAGYVVTVSTVIDGVTWQRAAHYGASAEAWRGYGWIALTNEE